MSAKHNSEGSLKSYIKADGSEKIYSYPQPPLAQSQGNSVKTYMPSEQARTTNTTICPTVRAEVIMVRSKQTSKEVTVGTSNEIDYEQAPPLPLSESVLDLQRAGGAIMHHSDPTAVGKNPSALGAPTLKHSDPTSNGNKANKPPSYIKDIFRETKPLQS